jgi:putative FmdB family regulatory protein
MPTYEYECQKCKKQFKIFVKSFEKGQEEVECPYCESDSVRRRFSSFSLGGCFSSTDSGCGSSSRFG